MVATHDLLLDNAVTQVLLESLGDHEVIQPPADIFGTGVHHVGPEGPAVAGVGVEDAERVQEALLKQFTEALPLLVRVARRLVPVAGRVL